MYNANKTMRKQIQNVELCIKQKSALFKKKHIKRLVDFKQTEDTMTAY